MYAKELLAFQIASDEFGHILWGIKEPITLMTINKGLNMFFQAKHIPPSHWNFWEHKLHFNFVLAYVLGAENPAANHLSCLEIQPEDRKLSTRTNSIPGFIIASKTPEQETDKKGCYPHYEADEGIWKHRSIKPDDKPLGHTQQKHPASTENDVHQKTAQELMEVGKKLEKDEMTLVRFVHTSSMPPRAINSVSPFNTVISHGVDENSIDIQEIKSIVWNK